MGISKGPTKFKSAAEVILAHHVLSGPAVRAVGPFELLDKFLDASSVHPFDFVDLTVLGNPFDLVVGFGEKSPGLEDKAVSYGRITAY